MTPINNLYAVRGCVFSEIIQLQNDDLTPVDTTGAAALFVIRAFQNGPIYLQIDQTDGISFGVSNMTVTVSETAIESLPCRTMHFDLFLQLQSDVKRKILTGVMEVE